MTTSKHIVILPFNGQGHLIPTLALAKKLVANRSELTITIATTPLTSQFIRSTILSESSNLSSSESNIRVLELPFNSSDHGLPPNIENTDSLSFTQIQLLIRGIYKTLPVHFRSLVSSIIAEDGHPPLCIIFDLVLGWAIEIAKNLEIPSIGFIVSGAFGSMAGFSFWQNLPHRHLIDDSDEYTLPGLPEKYRFKASDLLPFIREADGNDDISKYVRGIIFPALSSDGLLCNTVEEIEGIELELFRNSTKLPVWAIGPLLPSTMLKDNSSSTSSYKTFGQHGVKKYAVSPSKCIEWLDLHSQGSVIYISFGSQLTISIFQMMELAKGLEESGHPFIWVINPPLGFDKKEEFRSEWLPETFKEKMERTGQGLLVHGWAPQLEILSHKSTGAYLSHCGWNSMLESLSQGVPIIGWPMIDDQPYNLAYLMEMGVGVKLAGGLMSVIMSKEVSRIIDMVMDKNKGKRVEMKKKLDEIVKKMRAAVRDDDGGGNVKGSSLKAMDDFINTLQKRE